MTLSDFKSLLAQYPNAPFQLRLPDGDAVPVSFHITEVGRVQKTFIDCGGTLREAETCVLQAWVGSDDDHRLATSKLAGILRKAQSFLPNDDIPVEIEYETTLMSQYTIDDIIIGDGIVLQLAAKHTDCLAKEICLVPKAGASNCGCGPGCC
jgi:hypothetical protein